VGAQLRYCHNHAERAVRGASQPDAGGPQSRDLAAWLGEEPADARQLKGLLAPYPSEEMFAWPIGPRVGNVKNNDPSLVEPIALQ
jgi:hypothetical protein